MHSADFKRMLAIPAPWRSNHFAVHYVAGAPSRRPAATTDGASPDELSTASVPKCDLPVDKVWLGTVLPKRHARRAVTRNLLRRQIRSAVHRHLAMLPSGMWLVRLRRPFGNAQGAFGSAASDELRRAARAELDAMLRRAAAS